MNRAKLCIIANGCHENHMDAELLKNYLTNEFITTHSEHHKKSLKHDNKRFYATMGLS
jgi:tRNA A37 methylthiotransferase MiaB